MAKSNTTQAAPQNANSANKAKAIRDYKATNPNATPSEIAKALAGQGVAVNASRVSTVLGNGKKREKALDVDTIKEAAAFVKQYRGKTEDAIKAIDAVGGFVEKCGSASNAKKAIETYVALAESLKS